MIFALIVAVVTLAFALKVYRQYRERGKVHQLYWSIALFQSFIASLAYVLAMALGGSAFFFKLYYIFGALLAAAYLGLGSMHLMWPGRASRAALWGVLVFSAWGTAAIFQAPVNAGELAALGGGPGKDVLEGRGWLPPLIVMNTFGTVAVVAPALLSAWSVATRKGAAALAKGNVLIAVGVLLVASAGTMARLGAGGFWFTMAVGWAIAYLGFLTIASGDAESRSRAQA